MSSSVWIEKDKWFTVMPTWSLWTWIWIFPNVPKKYLDPFFTPTRTDGRRSKENWEKGRFSKGDPILSLTKGSDSSWKERRHKRLACLVRLIWSCVPHVKEKRSFAAFVLLRYNFLYRCACSLIILCSLLSLFGVYYFCFLVTWLNS